MSVRIDWLVENRVIIWESSNRVTLQEYAIGNQRLREMLAQTRRQGIDNVHIFVDGFRVESAPTNILAMKQNFTYLKEGGYDWQVICVRQPRFYQICINFAFSFANQHIIVEDDLVDGLRFLQEKDETLPDLLESYRRWVRRAPAQT